MLKALCPPLPAPLFLGLVGVPSSPQGTPSVPLPSSLSGCRSPLSRVENMISLPLPTTCLGAVLCYAAHWCRIPLNPALSQPWGFCLFPARPLHLASPWGPPRRQLLVSVHITPTSPTNPGRTLTNPGEMLCHCGDEQTHRIQLDDTFASETPNSMRAGTVPGCVTDGELQTGEGRKWLRLPEWEWLTNGIMASLFSQCPCSQMGLEASLLWYVWPFSGSPGTPHH